MDVDGTPVTVVRKNIKNLYLTVLPDGAVRVTAPRRIPDKAVRDFVRDRAGWIARQQERLARLSPAEPGQTLFQGHRYRLCFDPAHPPGPDGGLLYLPVPPDSTEEQRAQALERFCRSALQNEIALRLPVWEGITGLYCTGWQIRSMKTRWGSCTPSAGTLRFSLALIRQPPICLDYVLLHELAHLKVPNHGDDFTALLDRYMPGWRAVRALLNGRA